MGRFAALALTLPLAIALIAPISFAQSKGSRKTTAKNPPATSAAPDLDHERFTLERERFEKESIARDKELALREREITLKQSEQNTSNYPLYIAIIAAAAGLFGNILVTFLQGRANRALATLTAVATQQLEKEKAQANLILEAIKTGSPEKAGENLKFFIGTGLLTDPDSRITNWVRDQPSPSLPAPLETLFAGTEFKLTVVDAVTNSPIAAAEVSLSPAYFVRNTPLGSTDSSGELIAYPQPGTYLLQVHKERYSDWSVTINIPPLTEQTARLTPLA